MRDVYLYGLDRAICEVSRKAVCCPTGPNDPGIAPELLVNGTTRRSNVWPVTIHKLLIPGTSCIGGLL